MVVSAVIACWVGVARSTNFSRSARSAAAAVVPVAVTSRVTPSLSRIRVCARNAPSRTRSFGSFPRCPGVGGRPVPSRTLFSVAGCPGQRHAVWCSLLGDGRAVVEVLDVLGDPGVQVGAAVAQAPADLDRSRTEAGPPRPPRVQGRFRDREVRRRLVDGEDAAIYVGVDLRAHGVLLRRDENRFALVTEGVQPITGPPVENRDGRWTDHGGRHIPSSRYLVGRESPSAA